MNTEIIKDRNSNFAMKVLVGGIFFIFGIASLKMYVGYAFLLISIIALTYTSGVEIDYEKHRIRKYVIYLWIVTGTWRKLYSYQRITVRRARKGIRQYARSTASTSSFSTFYDVYLISDTLHDSILLHSSRDPEDARTFAEQWSEKLNIPL